MSNDIMVELERVPVYCPGDIVRGRIRTYREPKSIRLCLEGAIILDERKLTFLEITNDLIVEPDAGGFTNFALRIPILANLLWHDTALPSTLRLPGNRGSVQYRLQVDNWQAFLLLCNKQHELSSAGFQRVESEFAVGEDSFTAAMVIPSTGFPLGSYVQSQGAIDGLYIGLTSRSPMLKPMYSEIHAVTLNIVTRVSKPNDTVEHIYNLLSSEDIHYHILERHESASSVLREAQPIPIEIPPTTLVPGLRVEHFLECGLRIRSILSGSSEQVWLRDKVLLSLTEQSLYAR